MKLACTTSDLPGRIARAAILAVFSLVASVLGLSAQTPSALVQNSTLSGTTNTINITQLPVVTSKGTIIYDNVVIQFDVADDGALTITSGFPQITLAPRPIVNGFVAGTYLGPDDKTELITVSGPSVGTDGYTVWTISPGPGSSGCLVPYSATWYDVGSNTAANPLYANRLKPDGITGPQLLQFGTGKANTCNPNDDWGTNTLLGFSQVGKTLTISSYTGYTGDSPTVVDQRTYILQP